MFNSGMLDVVLGLVFIYLLLSLVCMALNEIVESLLKHRASDLERGIRLLLQDNTGTLAKSFYEHPLVAALYPGSYDLSKQKRNLPSYIPRRTFSLAVMDLMLPADSSRPSGAAGSMATSSTTTGATIRGGGSAMAGAAPGQGAGATGAGPTPQPLQALRDAVALQSNEPLRRALLPLIDAAAGDIAKARENIEAWYDSAMDRVSGWYKRRVQWIVFGIGLVLTIILNVDSIRIAMALSHDVSLREAVVRSAQEYARASAGTGAPAPDPTAKEKACKANQNSPECRLERALTEIRGLGLPIGWGEQPGQSSDTNPLARFLGWLITAAALSLGAPFWFDVLNKIIVVRSTVKPKEKSPDEPSVDR
jgi:hypothetical protein